MMRIGIICIGDELLIGQVIDSNSAKIALLLSELSLSVSKKWTCADDYIEIQETLISASEKCDLIILSGGLGPTKDDITKKALADFFKVDLVFSDENYKHMFELLNARNITVKEEHKTQCMIPSNAQLLDNKLGTAMGLWIENSNKTYIALPGVPDELNDIMKNAVLPKLIQIQSDTFNAHRTFHTIGFGETDIATQIEPRLVNMPSYIKLAYLPAIAQVRIRLSGVHSDEKLLITEIEHYADEIRAALGTVIFGEGDTNIALELGKLLVKNNLKIGTVESCTGGKIASMITSNPGSSDYFKSGLVTYATDSKVNLLNIDPNLIDQKGVVSEEIAREMVKTASKLLACDVVISSTGIAGPDGGSSEIPVGTIFIAVGNTQKQMVKKLRLSRNRDRNIEAATILALSLCRDCLIPEAQFTLFS